jgi:hypothetical protein
MSDQAVLRERYLRDSIPVRLGNLASSIKRLGYFTGLNQYDETVLMLIQECRSFSSWTFPDVDVETKAELEVLQHDLKNWEGNFQSSNGNNLWRAKIAAACETWSNRLLDLSGLLKTGLPAR